jgi:hypothetical protein
MKWIIGVLVVLIVVGAGLWWSGVLKPYFPGSQTQAPVSVATTTPTQQTQAAPVNDLPTQPSDTSDAALTQDTAAIDAQMSGLSSDSSSMDQSFNDQPTAQEF